MLSNAPPGSDGAPHPTGWMTASNFLRFLEHLKKNVRCSKENPCLIILDNHESHISIESINYSKNNGIHLLTIPPHTSQKLQPLDRIVFSSLKSHYNTTCDDWMFAHPACTLTIYELAACLGKAYPNAMTPRNIMKSFEVCGIYPFNSDIFTDDEFLSCFVTDRPAEASGSRNSEMPEQGVTDEPEEVVIEASDGLEEAVAERPPTAANINNNTGVHGPEEVVTDASGAGAAPSDDQQSNLTLDRESPSLLVQIPATDHYIAKEPNLEASSTGSALTSFPTLEQLAFKCFHESYPLANASMEETVKVPNAFLATATATSSGNILTAPASTCTSTRVSVGEAKSTITSIGDLPHGDGMSANTPVITQTVCPRNEIPEGSSKLTWTLASQRVLSPIEFTSLANENLRTPSKMSNTSLQPSIIAPLYISPEVIRPYPKAGPRKTVTKGRKKGSTRILTDTPEKIALENEAREKEDKKMKKLAASAKRKLEKENPKKKSQIKKLKK